MAPFTKDSSKMILKMVKAKRGTKQDKDLRGSLSRVRNTKERFTTPIITP
jgi:hypothetical protein